MMNGSRVRKLFFKNGRRKESVVCGREQRVNGNSVDERIENV